jgi:hypothetical protein
MAPRRPTLPQKAWEGWGNPRSNSQNKKARPKGRAFVSFELSLYFQNIKSARAIWTFAAVYFTRVFMGLSAIV